MQLDDLDNDSLQHLETINDKLIGRIVGGVDAKIEDFPYQASLQSEYDHMCGAAIISETHLISAAHCVYELRPSELAELKILAGSTTFEGDDNAQFRRVAKVTIHPRYQNREDSDVNDICVLVLAEPLEFNQYVQPIEMPDQGSVELPEGSKVVVSGWGTTNEDNDFLPGNLKSVSIPVVSNEKCNKSYKKQVTSDMMCAGFDEGGGDSCQGDSGGPLVHKNKLVGIVSWGIGCGRPKYPGVYAKVSMFRNWIREQTGI